MVQIFVGMRKDIYIILIIQEFDEMEMRGYRKIFQGFGRYSKIINKGMLLVNIFSFIQMIISSLGYSNWLNFFLDIVFLEDKIVGKWFCGEISYRNNIIRKEIRFLYQDFLVYLV